MSWRRVGAVDWWCPEPARGDRTVRTLGFVLGRGYAHESPAELGLTEAAAASLRLALGRPVETGDHQLLELEVGTEVNLQDTVVTLRGDVASLRHGAHALESLLAEPVGLERTKLPDPRRFPWTGWNEELVAWFGAGPVTLAAESETPWVGAVEELQEAVRRLHPARTAATAAWTTEPELVGAAFAQVPEHPADVAPPLGWRDPAPTEGGVGWVRASFDNNLLSARVGGTAVDEVAVRLVARTVHRHLVELTQLVPELQFFLEQVGDHQLLGIRATPQPGETSWPAVQTALVQALETSSTFSEAFVVEAIERTRSAASVAAALEPRRQAATAVRRARRREQSEVTDGLAALTVPQVQAAVARVRSAVLLGARHDQELPDPARTWQPAPLPPIAQPTLTQRSVVGLPLHHGLVRQQLRGTATALEQTLSTGRGRRSVEVARTAVDLSALAARLDVGETWSTLVDRENRRVVLAWPAYRRAGQLRALVDAATPPPLRMVGRVLPAHTASLRSRLRRRLARRVVPLTLALLLVALPIGVVWIPEALTDYQEPVVSTVPLGAKITLANGSTVRLDHERWRRVAATQTRVRLVDVRYCGGGVTVDRSTSEQARNYVTWERFDGVGVTPVGRAALPLEAGEVPLAAGTLEQGQCLSGSLGFTDGSAAAGDRRITYRNGSGDELAWLLP